jgi:hypothetical protein
MRCLGRGPRRVGQAIRGKCSGRYTAPTLVRAVGWSAGPPRTPVFGFRPTLAHPGRHAPAPAVQAAPWFRIPRRPSTPARSPRSAPVPRPPCASPAARPPGRARPAASGPGDACSRRTSVRGWNRRARRARWRGGARRARRWRRRRRPCAVAPAAAAPRRSWRRGGGPRGWAAAGAAGPCTRPRASPCPPPHSPHPRPARPRAARPAVAAMREETPEERAERQLRECERLGSARAAAVAAPRFRARHPPTARPPCPAPRNPPLSPRQTPPPPDPAPHHTPNPPQPRASRSACRTS